MASTGHLCRVSSKLEGGPSWQISMQKRVVLAKFQGLQKADTADTADTADRADRANLPEYDTYSDVRTGKILELDFGVLV